MSTRICSITRVVAKGVIVYVNGRRPESASPAAMPVMLASATPQL